MVHAPDRELRTDDDRRVVDAKRQWILEKLRHPQKYQEPPHPPGKEVVNGESAPYLGRDYRIEIAETESGEIEFVAPLPGAAYAASQAARGTARLVYRASQRKRYFARAEQHARELGVTFTAREDRR